MLTQMEAITHLSTPAGPIRGVAITREVSESYNNCALEFNERSIIDVDLARLQHRQYVKALKEFGLEVVVLPPVNEFPDGCFVEDTAVVLGDVGIITWMGTESRNGEQEQVAECLRRWVDLVYMAPPATLEGGDVLRVGQEIFVGRSRRTNSAGVRFLRKIAGAAGFRVTEVPVHHYLHLKTAITCVQARTFVTANGMGKLIQGALDDCDIVKLPTDCAYAANVLTVGNNILVPVGYPKATALMRQTRLHIREVEMSEFRKGEGGLTCLSVII